MQVSFKTQKTCQTKTKTQKQKSMDEVKNFFLAWLIAIASLCYCYLLASKIPKGMLRLLSLIPIFSLFTLIPLSLYRPWSILIFSGFITWITTFKLLVYAFNLGPLSTNDPDRSLLRFVILGALPIKIKVNLDNIPKKKVIPLNYWSKCALFFVLNVVYSKINSVLMLSCIVYLFIEVAYGVCVLFVRTTLGLEIEPPSDEPYLSTSLQDFWGRRWNLMVSDALRHTIYKPIRSVAARFLDDKWVPVPGVMAAFVVSGLMHELLYYYMTRVKPTWEVTSFFVLHGVCVVLEIAVKRGLGQKWRIPWAISGPLSIGFVIVTGVWLLFPQIVRNHVDDRATEDIVGFINYLKEVALEFKTWVNQGIS